MFDNDFLILKQLEVHSQFLATSFDTEVFWVEFNKLSVICMNRKYDELIENTLRRVLDVEVEDDDTSWGVCLESGYSLILPNL